MASDAADELPLLGQREIQDAIAQNEGGEFAGSFSTARKNSSGMRLAEKNPRSPPLFSWLHLPTRQRPARKILTVSEAGNKISHGTALPRSIPRANPAAPPKKCVERESAMGW